jgi:hypothetical protein
METAALLALAELEIRRLATVVVEAVEVRIIDIIFVMCVCVVW